MEYAVVTDTPTTSCIYCLRIMPIWEQFRFHRYQNTPIQETVSVTALLIWDQYHNTCSRNITFHSLQLWLQIHYSVYWYFNYRFISKSVGFFLYLKLTSLSNPFVCIVLRYSEKWEWLVAVGFLCVRFVWRHEDGTVRFWDASGVALRPLYKLSTANIFQTDCDHNDGLTQASEEEWPPFQKVSIWSRTCGFDFSSLNETPCFFRVLIN